MNLVQFLTVSYTEKMHFFSLYNIGVTLKRGDEGMIKIDLHMHTTISDGTDRPEEILENARKAGLSVFSVTDHDAVKCSTILPKLLRKGDPDFISGVEFSCKDEKGKYHILGYGYDPESEPVQNVVETGHNYRMDTVRRRLKYLSEIWDIRFPEDEVETLLALDNPGKPHIANLMVKCGFASSKRQAFDEYINKIPNADLYVHPKDAIEGILGSGGIPVLAHPFFGSGSSRIPASNLSERVEHLRGFGLSGIEVFYSDFDDELIRRALKIADDFGMYVTAGSDYHGENKKVPLGETGMARYFSGQEISDDLPEVPGLVRFLSDVRKIRVS